MDDYIVEICKRLDDELLSLAEKVPKSYSDYCLTLQNSTESPSRISDLWDDGRSVFFPLFFDDDFYKGLNVLARTRMDDYLLMIEKIKVPFILREVIIRSFYQHERNQILLEILKKSKPITKNYDDYYSLELESIIAPTVIDVIVEIIYSENHKNNINQSAGEDNQKELSNHELLSGLCDVLSKRDDGFILTYHYLKYLLKREQKSNVYYDVLNALSEIFTDESKKYFFKDGHLNIEGLDYTHDELISFQKSFENTGELLRIDDQFDEDVLINYRTVLLIVGIDNNEKIFLDGFKSIYQFGAHEFYTNDIKPCLKHFDVAKVIIAQDKPAKSWLDIYEYSLSAINRIAIKYHSDYSMEIRYRHYFMWDVGLRMLDQYFDLMDESEECIHEVYELWKVLWNEALGYIRKFARFVDDDEYSYIAALICWYYIAFIKKELKINDNEKSDYCIVKQQLQEIQEFPIAVVIAIKMMMKNELEWKKLFSCDENFFNTITRRTRLLIIEIKRYIWIGEFLNELERL